MPPLRASRIAVVTVSHWTVTVGEIPIYYLLPTILLGDRADSPAAQTGQAPIPATGHQTHKEVKPSVPHPLGQCLTFSHLSM